MKRKSVLLEYFNKYKITYIIIISLFLIGVFIGVIYINMSNENKIKNLTEYVTQLIYSIKEYPENKENTVLISSISKNIKDVLIIWFLGCTIGGCYFIYITVMYQGFKIGYTIATFIYIMGIKNGIVFSLSSLLLQNIIYIPTIFFMAESSIKMYKQTYKNRGNVKKEFLRHFIILCICFCLCMIASFVEISFSAKILKKIKEIF